MRCSGCRCALSPWCRFHRGLSSLGTFVAGPLRLYASELPRVRNHPSLSRWSLLSPIDPLLLLGLILAYIAAPSAAVRKVLLRSLALIGLILALSSLNRLCASVTVDAIDVKARSAVGLSRFNSLLTLFHVGPGGAIHFDTLPLSISHDPFTALACFAHFRPLNSEVASPLDEFAVDPAIHHAFTVNFVSDRAACRPNQSS